MLQWDGRISFSNNHVYCKFILSSDIWRVLSITYILLICLVVSKTCNLLYFNYMPYLVQGCLSFQVHAHNQLDWPSSLSSTLEVLQLCEVVFLLFVCLFFQTEDNDDGFHWHDTQLQVAEQQFLEQWLREIFFVFQAEGAHASDNLQSGPSRWTLTPCSQPWSMPSHRSIACYNRLRVYRDWHVKPLPSNRSGTQSVTGIRRLLTTSSLLC